MLHKQVEKYDIINQSYYFNHIERVFILLLLIEGLRLVIAEPLSAEGTNASPGMCHFDSLKILERLFTANDGAIEIQLGLRKYALASVSVLAGWLVVQAKYSFPRVDTRP